MPRQADPKRRSPSRTSVKLEADQRRALLAWAEAREKAAGVPPGSIGLGGAIRAAIAFFVTPENEQRQAALSLGYEQAVKASWRHAQGKLGAALGSLQAPGADEEADRE